MILNENKHFFIIVYEDIINTLDNNNWPFSDHE